MADNGPLEIKDSGMVHQIHCGFCKISSCRPALNVFVLAIIYICTRVDIFGSNILNLYYFLKFNGDVMSIFRIADINRLCIICTRGAI